MPTKKNTLRVTRLQLENWRNFTSVDIPLEQRAFLVGPNASGKSNLLDALRFLHDLVAEGGGMGEAVNRRGGLSRLRCLAARSTSDVAVRLDIGNDEHPAEWTYRLQFGQDRQSRPIVSEERVEHEGQIVLQRPNDDDHADPARLTQTHLQQVNTNLEFRPVSEFLATVRYLHVVPQLVRDPERSLGRHDDPYGGDLIETIAGTRANTRTARLRRIGKALQVAVPQLSELELLRDEVRGTPHLRANYQHWRARGAWQNEDQFSDGTLRLIGLLWAVLEGSGPLLLEEPELSLHPELVRRLPQMLARLQRESGRQVLMSTHSAEILRDEGIDLNEVILLSPDPEGTHVSLAGDNSEARALLEGGLSMADAVIPLTAPVRAAQLPLFDQ